MSTAAKRTFVLDLGVNPSLVGLVPASSDVHQREVRSAEDRCTSFVERSGIDELVWESAGWLCEVMNGMASLDEHGATLDPEQIRLLLYRFFVATYYRCIEKGLIK